MCRVHICICTSELQTHDHVGWRVVTIDNCSRNAVTYFQFQHVAVTALQLLFFVNKKFRRRHISSLFKACCYRTCKTDTPGHAYNHPVAQCCRNQIGLVDGNWVFQVRGVATSGVSGITASASFLVDSTAPTISNLILSYTVKKQVVNVTVSKSGSSAKVPTADFRVYTVASDGLLGSGVNPNR